MRNLAEKLFKFLAKCHLVLEHKEEYNNIIDLTSPQSLPDFCGDRFVFKVSYVQRILEFSSEYWFTNRKGKKLFVVWHNHHLEGRFSYRADLKSFLCHFSPRLKVWVDSNSPVVYLQQDSYPLSMHDYDLSREVAFKTHRCDFSQCRYAFEFSHALPHINRMPNEVLAESQKALKNRLTSKVSEINKILTGADYDGEIVSPKNMPLSQNLLCRHCGLPVFASAKDKYQFECLEHGELDYDWVMRVDPVEYEKVLGNTLDILEDLIQKSCPQDSNL